MNKSHIFIFFVSLFVHTITNAQQLPITKNGSWTVQDFKFHTGEVLPELKLSYITLGNPKGDAVLILHGTTGSASGMLTPAFAGELFGPGQPLDATRYFVILTDSIGTGNSSKPSDGLRAKFPAYNYNDTVRAQHRLITEHLGIKHLRLVLGNSMGGMQTWIWAQMYPEMMDIAVPMASLPSPMSGRNWMLRRMLSESIRNDPLWMQGDYSKPPPSWQFASIFFSTATNGGTLGLQRLTPTSDAGNALLKQRLSAPFAGDANDHLYQWESSKDYDASHDLEKIQATVLVINSADDERNPPELGILEKALPRIKNAKAFVIQGSPETSGHGTTSNAKFWKNELESILDSAPRLP
jgi:homoserine O-acetyltransferase/O-succinyltransferase